MKYSAWNNDSKICRNKTILLYELINTSEANKMK